MAFVKKTSNDLEYCEKGVPLDYRYLLVNSPQKEDLRQFWVHLEDGNSAWTGRNVKGGLITPPNIRGLLFSSFLHFLYWCTFYPYSSEGYATNPGFTLQKKIRSTKIYAGMPTKPPCQWRE